MKSFHTIVAGNTLGAHCAFIRKLEAIGQTEVTSGEPYDYSLVFCPIVSRVGTDISEAMGKIPRHAPGDKPVILVVMHHTIHADSFVSNSSRHVTMPNVILTVDCLFHETRFLDCNWNEKAFSEIKRTLGHSHSKVPITVSIWNYVCNWHRNIRPKPLFKVTLAVALSGLLVFYVVRHYVPALSLPLVDLPAFPWTPDQH